MSEKTNPDRQNALAVQAGANVPDQAQTKRPSMRFCPRCAYSLKGLPAVHRCPECGLRYDEHSRMWRASGFSVLRDRIKFGNVLLLVVFFFSVIEIAAYAVRLGSPLLGWLWLATIAGFAAFAISKLYRQGSLVAATVDGLYIRNAKRGLLDETNLMSELKAWRDIESVIPHDISTRARVIVKGACFDVGEVFKNTRAVRDFISTVRHYLDERESLDDA